MGAVERAVRAGCACEDSMGGPLLRKQPTGSGAFHAQRPASMPGLSYAAHPPAVIFFGRRGWAHRQIQHRLWHPSPNRVAGLPEQVIENDGWRLCCPERRSAKLAGPVPAGMAQSRRRHYAGAQPARPAKPRAASLGVRSGRFPAPDMMQAGDVPGRWLGRLRVIGRAARTCKAAALRVCIRL